MNEREQRISRRAVLAGLAGTSLSASAGCMRSLETAFGRESPEPLSLSIKVVPADVDPAATHIARQLAQHLDAVGIDARVTPVEERNLLQQVLVNHDFDLYVAQHPGDRDPDYLRPLLHSRYIEEPGWQNPFGYVNRSVDELLEEQCRYRGIRRSEALGDLNNLFHRDCPFTVLAFPTVPGGASHQRYTGWETAGIDGAVSYLALQSTTDEPDGTLRITLVDNRATKNRNPLAVEFRNWGTVVDLLYDSLAKPLHGQFEPWLAESWNWRTGSHDDGLVADLRLREGLRWHDGRQLTSKDVAFTYRFLDDTSLGNAESPVPAPRYRGQSALVEAVETVDDRTVRFEFRECSPEIARRAFAVPVLPKHEWHERAERAQVAGIDIHEYATEALVWDNPEPVGSGPLRFETADEENLLVLSRFDGHFLRHADVGGALEPVAGGPSFARLELNVVPSSAVALQLIEEGEADATARSVRVADIPKIDDADGIERYISRETVFYHVGFNVRHPPLGNPRFRRTVSRLLDREQIASDIFDGFAEASSNPLLRTDAPKSTTEIDDEASLDFLGGDGTLNVSAARRRFRDAGYRYDGENRLLVDR